MSASSMRKGGLGGGRVECRIETRHFGGSFAFSGAGRVQARVSVRAKVRVTRRPFAGTTTRTDTGRTPRPFTGQTVHTG
jgi:hypothetical protein